MVLEGVHIVPGMISVDRTDALVVQCVVAISDEDLHRSHFWVRDATTDGLRPLEKYLDGMTEIRMIQDVLLERARRFDVPVIENTSFDEAIGQMLDLVLTGAERLAPARTTGSARPSVAYARVAAWSPRTTSSKRCTGSRIPSSAWTSSRSASSTRREIEGSNVKIIHSLTSMGCPAGPMIQEGIHDAVAALPGVEKVDVELTFDPPWTPDRMSDDAKFILGFG